MIYEYQLEGYDKEWKILRGINSIKFSNLSPGEYTFKVRKQMDENSMQSFQIRIRSSFICMAVVRICLGWSFNSWCYLYY
ncbi:MAG: triple tyrosine motif-containing protein [Bacteroides cellulosilyticus]